MHPETAADRLNLLGDFGVECTVTPKRGGSRWTLAGIYLEPAERVQLDPDGNVETVATDPYLRVRAEDVTGRLLELDAIEIPGAPVALYRVNSIEHAEDDGAFRDVQLLEAE